MRNCGRWILGAFLVGFLLGMAVGVSADPGTTRNYATQTISFYFYQNEMIKVPECPEGWKWEAYLSVPDPENVPAFVSVLLTEGVCPRG